MQETRLSTEYPWSAEKLPENFLSLQREPALSRPGPWDSSHNHCSLLHSQVGGELKSSLYSLVTSGQVVQTLLLEWRRVSHRQHTLDHLIPHVPAPALLGCFKQLFQAYPDQHALCFLKRPRLKHWVVSLSALVFPQCQHFKSQVCAALIVRVNSGKAEEERQHSPLCKGSSAHSGLRVQPLVAFRAFPRLKDSRSHLVHSQMVKNLHLLYKCQPSICSHSQPTVRPLPLRNSDASDKIPKMLPASLRD